MKDYYWQKFFKKIFLLSSFLLLALNSSSLYSGGPEPDDKDFGGGRETATVKVGEYASGSYYNPTGNDGSRDSGDWRGGHKTQPHVQTKLMGGRIQGSFNVDGSSGSAQYSIPIIVPAGHGGMEPKLQLSYSSGGGNGHYGVGWEMVGLPVVHRCGTNKVLDSANLTSQEYKMTTVTWKEPVYIWVCLRRNWWGSCTSGQHRLSHHSHHHSHCRLP